MYYFYIRTILVIVALKLQNGLMPKVSIVMTSYNYEKYIAEAIESILNQTFRDFELIIVDDCSKDKSREIIEAYAKKDGRLRYLFHERNMGLSRSTNDGFSMCLGDYIAIIDSDDCWDNSKLKLQLDIFERKPNIDVVYTGTIIIDEKSTSTSVRFSQIYNSQTILFVITSLLKGLTNIAILPEFDGRRSGKIFGNLLRNNFVNKSSSIFRAYCIKDVIFKEEMKLLNDWIFWLDLAKKHEFYYIPQPLTKYRIHQKSMVTATSSTEWERDFDRAYMIKRKYLYLLPTCGRIKFIIFQGLSYVKYLMFSRLGKNMK